MYLALFLLAAPSEPSFVFVERAAMVRVYERFCEPKYPQLGTFIACMGPYIGGATKWRAVGYTYGELVGEPVYYVRELPSVCSAHDLDHDGDVDLADFAIGQR